VQSWQLIGGVLDGRRRDANSENNYREALGLLTHGNRHKFNTTSSTVGVFQHVIALGSGRRSPLVRLMVTNFFGFRDEEQLSGK
jgi:hypothetical protein